MRPARPISFSSAAPPVPVFALPPLRGLSGDPQGVLTHPLPLQPPPPPPLPAGLPLGGCCLMVLAAAGGGVDVLWNVFERFYWLLFFVLVFSFLVFVCGVIIFSVMF